LNLKGTKVTDRGLNRLRPLKALKSLDLTETGVTDEGADAIRKALPGATVVRRR
jgi:hypothetical protein